ncbi:unnamed protein product [Rotaria sordida]|uniref:Dynamin N-terminal domain-containing protein n=1 Tax=Rotaria sordida TaxID=392033 RepID=A0A815R715_9BILA|nr:unnamed protein product [Rotaria sordida]
MSVYVCGLFLIDYQRKQTVRQYPMIDSAIFEAYEILRKTALDYNLEHDLAVPRIVFVGDTSSGKSMLIQMFLRFPFAFSQANVGTRCPVQYKLRYDRQLADDEIRFIQPGNWRAEDLGNNLQTEMAQIEKKWKHQGGFCVEPFVVEIASKKYTDIEILDVPGLVSGDQDANRRATVERITQRYVRDPNFMIVQIKEAQQLVDNTYGTRRIGELCTEEYTQSDSSFPPRHDYMQHTITIQMKFDAFVREHVNGTDANQDIQTRINAFPNTYFTNVIFDTDYAAYRAEVNNMFDQEDYGRTYEQIENEYNAWNRKESLTWRAYLSADQLKRHPNERLERITTLDLLYVGARHFERLRQRDRAWFESSQSLLYGVMSDNENVEKAIRESLFTFIRETFLIGICWLTQMYTFLTDHFARHVKSLLLSRQFSYLNNHIKFLSLVDLEYHRVTRKFIRQAIEAIQHARYAKMVYAAHDILGTLQNLVRSIPCVHTNNENDDNENKTNLCKTISQVTSDTISNAISRQRPTTAKASSLITNTGTKMEPLKLIYSKGGFSIDNRHPQDAKYLTQTRDTVLELYTAVRGQLVCDITTFFFANVVTKIQDYKSILIENSVQNRINLMSNEKIALLANIEINHSRQIAIEALDQLKNLEQARDAIENAIARINDPHTKSTVDENDGNSDDRKQRIRAMRERTRRKQFDDIEKKLKANQHQSLTPLTNRTPTSSSQTTKAEPSKAKTVNSDTTTTQGQSLSR